MALASFSSIDRSVLRWIRTSESPAEFTLSAGETPVAVLRWKAHGGSLATAETASGRWTLKRVGFLNPQITVRPEGTPETLARLTAHLNHQEIALPGGPRFRLQRAGMLVPAWRITAPNGREVLHIEPAREGRRLEAGAVLEGDSPVAPEQQLLLAVIGWYFIVLVWFEDEALVALERLEGADGGPEKPGSGPPSAAATSP